MYPDFTSKKFSGIFGASITMDYLRNEPNLYSEPSKSHPHPEKTFRMRMPPTWNNTGERM